MPNAIEWIIIAVVAVGALWLLRLRLQDKRWWDAPPASGRGEESAFIDWREVRPSTIKAGWPVLIPVITGALLCVLAFLMRLEGWFWALAPFAAAALFYAMARTEMRRRRIRLILMHNSGVPFLVTHLSEGGQGVKEIEKHPLPADLERIEIVPTSGWWRPKAIPLLQGDNPAEWHDIAYSYTDQNGDLQRALLSRDREPLGVMLQRRNAIIGLLRQATTPAGAAVVDLAAASSKGTRL